MRILWTLPYLPWPTTSGGKTRQYHLLSSLAARGHRITLLVQSKTELDDATRAALEPWLERLIVLPRRSLRSLKTLLTVALAPPPMLASINGYAPYLQQTFEALLEEPWDAIQIEHTYSKRLLFIGNYEYSPNLDAVEWALDVILPRLWQLDPDVRFAICGYALPESWRQRWPDPRIEWQGFVPDLRVLQGTASVFFAPLRQGGGSKLKVLQAMAAGLPVVTTAQGSSGLQVVNGEHFLDSEDSEELAQIIAGVITQPTRLEQLGEAGRAYVRAEHDWAVAAAQLEEVYSRLQTAKDEDRAPA